MAPDLSAGNCGGTGDVMFPDPRAVAGVRRAKMLCAGCPLREKCLTYALDTGQVHGVWGGLSETERMKVRRRRAA